MDDSKFVCQYCNRRLSSKFTLRRHQRTVKSCILLQKGGVDTVDETLQNTAILCKYCNNEYSTLANLKRHILICRVKQEKEDDIKAATTLTNELIKIKAQHTQELLKVKLEAKDVEIKAKEEIIRIEREHNEKLSKQLTASNRPNRTTNNNNIAILNMPPLDLDNPEDAARRGSFLPIWEFLTHPEKLANLGKIITSDEEGKSLVKRSNIAMNRYLYKTASGEVGEDIQGNKIIDHTLNSLDMERVKTLLSNHERFDNCQVDKIMKSFIQNRDNLKKDVKGCRKKFMHKFNLTNYKDAITPVKELKTKYLEIVKEYEEKKKEWSVHVDKEECKAKQGLEDLVNKLNVLKSHLSVSECEEQNSKEKLESFKEEKYKLDIEVNKENQVSSDISQSDYDSESDAYCDTDQPTNILESSNTFLQDVDWNSEEEYKDTRSIKEILEEDIDNTENAIEYQHHCIKAVIPNMREKGFKEIHPLPFHEWIEENHTDEFMDLAWFISNKGDIL